MPAGPSPPVRTAMRLPTSLASHRVEHAYARDDTIM